MKAIRYILAIPISYFAIALIFWALSFLFLWGLDYFSEKKSFWHFCIALFVSSIIWAVFKRLAHLISFFVCRISPNRGFSLIVMALISIGIGIYTIYNSWTVEGIKYTSKIIFITVIYNLIIVRILGWLNLGASDAYRHDNEIE